VSRDKSKLIALTAAVLRDGFREIELGDGIDISFVEDGFGRTYKWFSEVRASELPMTLDELSEVMNRLVCLLAGFEGELAFDKMMIVTKNGMTEEAAQHLDEWCSSGRVSAFHFTLRGLKAALLERKRLLSDERSNGPFDGPFASSAKINNIQVVEKLLAITVAMKQLRINSLSEHIRSLEAVTFELQSISGAGETDLKTAVRKALNVLAGIFDVMGSELGARIIVSGAIGGLVGVGGLQAVVAYSLTIAAWMGKETFLEAVKTVNGTGPRRRLPPERPSKASKPGERKS
jgi:hypothetical protein